MIAVTGASGQLGRLVIDALLEKTNASDIVALVRNPDAVSDIAAKGVTVRKADYEQPDTFTEALRGVEKILLISSNAVGQRTQQHKTVIEAAQKANVKLFAYTSILKADSSPIFLAQEHKETEVLLQNSGLTYTFLRNGWYTENYTMSIKDSVAHGAVIDCSGEGRISSAARADYAEAAAVVLTSDIEKHANKTYELAGDQSFNLAEYAQEISAQTNKDVSYNDLSESDFKDALIQIGLPEGFAGALADAGIGVTKGCLEENSRTLSSLIGRPTTSMKASIASALS